jgi:5'(3')-deoxyribonucleotidase
MMIGDEMKKKIYIDMDGVVADFDKFVSNLLGRKIGWGVSDLTSAEWSKVAAVPNFYNQLDLIEDSEVMVAAALSFSTRFDVEFLTALPRESTMPTARADKTDWLAEHFPGVPINFGPFSRDKQKWFKTPGDILIDDKPSNVAEWVTAGGIAIHHQGDFAKTIDLLYHAVDKEQPMLLR